VSEAPRAWSSQYNGEETRAGVMVGSIRRLHVLTPEPGDVRSMSPIEILQQLTESNVDGPLVII
jgi:hypothetical protein